MEATKDRQSELLDLSHVLLPELLDLGDSVLARCVRRLLAEADRPQDVIAGFESAI